MKYRTKRRYLEIKVAKESNKPILADDIVLSPIEDTILNVISDGNMDELSIKTDPLDVCINPHIFKFFCFHIYILNYASLCLIDSTTFTKIFTCINDVFIKF